MSIDAGGNGARHAIRHGRIGTVVQQRDTSGCITMPVPRARRGSRSGCRSL